MKFFTTILFCIVLTGASASIFSELTEEIEKDRSDSKFSGAQQFNFIVANSTIEEIKDEHNETEESNKPTKQNFEHLTTLASKRYNSVLTAISNSLTNTLDNIRTEYSDVLNNTEELKVLTEEGLNPVAAIHQQVANIRTSAKLVRLTEAQTLIGFVAKLEGLLIEPVNNYNGFFAAIALKEESNPCDELITIAKQIVEHANFSADYVKYCYDRNTNNIENSRRVVKQQLMEVYDNLSTIFWEKLNCENGCSGDIAAASTDLSGILSKISEINKNEKFEESFEETSACLKVVSEQLKTYQTEFVEQIKTCYKSSA